MFLWLSGILIFSDRCWADVQEMITGQRKTLFLGEGKLRFFHVHFSVFILSVISWNETAGWLNSPLFGGTIQCFIVSFHGSQGMPGQKWPPLTGDCELASSLPDSEEGGKWQSRILPREQRWLDVRGWFLWTEIRFYWLSWGKLEIEISFPYECTSFWQGIVCRVVHLITLESIHSVAEELKRRAIQVQLNC